MNDTSSPAKNQEYTQSVMLIMMLFSWKKSGISQDVSGNDAVGKPCAWISEKYYVEWKDPVPTHLLVSTSAAPNFTSRGTAGSFLDQNHMLI